MRYLKATAAAVITAALTFTTVSTVPSASADDNTIGENTITGSTRAAKGAGYVPWDGWMTTPWCTPKAGTCFVGIGKLGKTRILRVDPNARHNMPGKGKTVPYKAATNLAKLKKAGRNTRGASPAAVACVAWMAGEYLSQGPMSGQALNHAALDIATRTRLYGGAWGINGKLATKAMKKTGRHDAIKARAQKMLSECAAQRGPYSIEVSGQKSVVAGEGAVPMSAILGSSATGFKLQNHPLIFKTGKTGKTVRTDSTGKASYTWKPTTPGKVTVAVQARVRPSTLLVRSAKGKGITRIIVRRQWTTVTRTRAVWVKERAQLKGLTCARKTVKTGGNPGCSVMYRGYDKSPGRATTSTLYGPFKSQKAATCDAGKTYRSAKFKVAKDGRYKLPSASGKTQLKKRGWYIWGVKTAKNKLNTSAEICAGKVKAT